MWGPPEPTSPQLYHPDPMGVLSLTWAAELKGGGGGGGGGFGVNCSILGALLLSCTWNSYRGGLDGGEEPRWSWVGAEVWMERVVPGGKQRHCVTPGHAPFLH